jgi:FkbM family methyltransferase
MSLKIAKVAVRKLKTAWKLTWTGLGLLHLGVYTPWEFMLSYVDRVAANCMRRDPCLYPRAKSKRLKKEYLRDGVYVFKDARLPLLDTKNELGFFSSIVDDIFLVYLKYDDCYDDAKINALYKFLPDGPYGLRNERVDVTIGDSDNMGGGGGIVLEAGSWIGDFAAYASAKGAEVYAFEPADETYEYLLQTAKLNKNIHPVKKGLGNAKTVEVLLKGESSIGNRIASGDEPGGERQRVEITTIDDFVKENHLERVDFIKADIEGHERYMLEGAQETLKKFAPKLALCTYHLPDDPEVLEGLIKKANPAYNVVQKQKKLYASVPRP